MTTICRLHDECRNRCSDLGYVLVGPYVDASTPMKISCSFHGTGYRTLKQIRKGKYCLACCRWRKNLFDSDVEFRVYRYLRLIGLNPEIHPSIPGSRCRFDFGLPEFKIMIEVDGNQHFQYVRKWHRQKGALAQQKLRDVEKTQWCQKNNHRLFRWCGDQLDKLTAIDMQWKQSIAEPKFHYMSNPERYPHLNLD